MVMDKIELEMEEIAKLYSYMSDEDKDNWTQEAAKSMYDDEMLYCNEHSIDNPLIGGVEVLYDTIREMIEQDA